MRRRERAAWAARIGLWVLAGPAWASAQQYTNPAAAPRSATPPLNPVMVYGNPAANPLLNPYLNPYGYGTPGTANQTAMGYYLFQANQANGGFGSGQLSGVRPAANANPNARSAKAKAAKDDPAAKDSAPAAKDAGRGVGTFPTNSTAPAAGAGKYFQRGMNTQSNTKNFYNRGRPTPQRKAN